MHVAPGRLTALVLGTISLFLLPQPARASSEILNEYVSSALQGDLTSAADLFDGAGELTESERSFRDRFRARFVDRTEARPPVHDDPLVREVVECYETYWTAVLLGDVSWEDGERELEESLTAALADHAIEVGSGADAIPESRRALEERGVHVLNGRTRPFLELMMWDTEEHRDYEVQLTDARRTVEVVFLSDFLVRGWSHFATFGKASTGGWAGKDALYCLREDYDLQSEHFRISYLRHETRHFADYELFPELDQIELEYRAKLTELCFAEESLLNLIDGFTSRASPNPSAPHSYANHAVVRDLSLELFGRDSVPAAEWVTRERGEIHRAAGRVLDRNTEALRADGALTTQGVVSRASASP